MRKEEFLQILRRALTGDVPPGVVEENIRYYDGYIADEVRKGRTEEEVIAEIGDPRLIARTIEDTTDGAGNSRYQSGSGYEYDSGPDMGRDEGGYARSPFDTGRSFHIFAMDKWYGSGVYDYRWDFCVADAFYRSAFHDLAYCDHYQKQRQATVKLLRMF